MNIKRSGMITIVGRPNVGKSTLTNALVGEKIAIVTNKPQTTRNRICAVLNRGDSQFVFIDTPGLHKARTKLGDYMVGVVKQSVADVDAVMLLVEPIANVGGPEEELIGRIRALGVPAVLVINKIDTVKKEDLLAVMWAYQAIPHGTAVEITRFSERDNEIIDVDATIYCEKTSHKGIIIGKNGAMLKKISSLARQDMEAFMGARVYLETWVKVKENWRDNLNFIHNVGYRDD